MVGTTVTATCTGSEECLNCAIKRMRTQLLKADGGRLLDAVIYFNALIKDARAAGIAAVWEALVRNIIPNCLLFCGYAVENHAVRDHVFESLAILSAESTASAAAITACDGIKKLLQILAKSHTQNIPLGGYCGDICVILGNIAQDDPPACQVMVRNRCFRVIARLIQNNINTLTVRVQRGITYMLESIAWQMHDSQKKTEAPGMLPRQIDVHACIDAVIAMVAATKDPITEREALKFLTRLIDIDEAHGRKFGSHNALAVISRALHSPDESISYEALNLLSNIAACIYADDMDTVLHPQYDIVPCLCKLAAEGNFGKLARWSVRALSNIISDASENQTDFLLGIDLLSTLVRGLDDSVSCLYQIESIYCFLGFATDKTARHVGIIAALADVLLPKLQLILRTLILRGETIIGEEDGESVSVKTDGAIDAILQIFNAVLVHAKEGGACRKIMGRLGIASMVEPLTHWQIEVGKTAKLLLNNYHQGGTTSMDTMD